MPPGLTVEDSPIEMLLKEQGTLQTPVGVFSAAHEAATAEPEQAQFYKQLLPLSKPKAGEQYAFKVDLDRCTGCKACVSACHSLNGLDEHETWRDVGSIHGVDLSGASYTQTVTTACHHCADPGCLNGCPVLAYEKDEETGIVRHLDDQCIGCQYCSLKCPYDVPKYSKSMGIVRKCDMCHGRLAEGEAPACVQSCPTEAISITIVNTQEVTTAAKAGEQFLAGAPAGDYTVPTTQYVTKRSVPENVEGGDHYSLKPEHAHLPLVFMLVLMQFSAGLYTAAFIAGEANFAQPLRWLAFVAMGLGLASSTSHLGRPLGAWRAFLGLRKSWLSREIVIFGAFSGVAVAYTVGGYFSFVPEAAVQLAGLASLVTAWIGTFCSVMIYADTQRAFWRFPVTFTKFFGSAVCLGLAGALAISAFSSEVLMPCVFGILTVFAVKLGMELTQLLPATSESMTAAKKSALIMLKPLANITAARYATGLFGMACFAALLVESASPVIGLFGFVFLLIGEFLERTLYFKAVVALKMPGSH